MKGIVGGAIMPHGFSIIEEIAGDEKELFKPTRDSMIKVGKEIINKRADVVIVLTPHGLRLKEHIAVYTSYYCRGGLAANSEEVRLESECDIDLANEVIRAGTLAGLPIVGCNYGALSGEVSNIEMDWGTLIPMWFVQADNYNPKIVVIGPTRDMDKKNLILLGKIIKDSCEKMNKSATIIASADQGHCHDCNGPYGYSYASKIYDDLINEIIMKDKLEELLLIEDELIEDAKPDSLWQMLILYGAIRDSNIKGELLSYQVPTYFGMTVAKYFEEGNDE